MQGALRIYTMGSNTGETGEEALNEWLSERELNSIYMKRPEWANL